MDWDERWLNKCGYFERLVESLSEHQIYSVINFESVNWCQPGWSFGGGSGLVVQERPGEVWCYGKGVDLKVCLIVIFVSLNLFLNKILCDNFQTVLLFRFYLYIYMKTWTLSRNINDYEKSFEYSSIWNNLDKALQGYFSNFKKPKAGRAPVAFSLF